MSKNAGSFVLQISPALLLAGAFFFFSLAYSGDLLILTEARDYVKWGGYVSDYPSFIADCFVPAGFNSRPVSMFGFHLMKAACGFDNTCINAFQLAVAALAGIFLYLHGLQVFRSAAAASLISAAWYFSLPVLDANFWQAVNHDKTGALFSFMALTLSYSFLHKERGRQRLTANFALTLLLLLAYNSKESTFFLMPLILVQYAVYSTGTRRAMANLGNLVVPFFFSAYYFTGYMLNLQTDMKSHVFSAAAAENVKHYGAFLLNRTEWSLWIPGLFALLVAFPAALLLYSAAAKRTLAGVDSPAGRNWIYSFCFFVLASAVALKTRHAMPYYMMMPLGGALFTAVAGVAVARRALSPTVLSRGVLPILAGLLILLQFKGFASLLFSTSYYTNLKKQSGNMEEAYRQIRRQVTLEEGSRFIFLIPEKDPNNMFLRSRDGNRPDDTLVNFIFRADGDYEVDYLSEVNLAKAKNAKAERDLGNVTFIHLGKDLQLLEIF